MGRGGSRVKQHPKDLAVIQIPHHSKCIARFPGNCMHCGLECCVKIIKFCPLPYYYFNVQNPEPAVLVFQGKSRCSCEKLHIYGSKCKFIQRSKLVDTSVHSLWLNYINQFINLLRIIDTTEGLEMESSSSLVAMSRIMDHKIYLQTQTKPKSLCH